MKKMWNLWAALSCAFLLAASPALAVKSDEVVSRHVMEADGTSGQDTEAGSGIKTGHLQDGAVTGAKIADGAVTDAKISGVISAAKIDGEGLDADMVDGLHASDLAPAVHGHWISDVSDLESILGGKAELGHDHAGVYALATHDHTAEYQGKYANVLVVAKGGGDFASPLAAMASIADASASNPYLVRIMPGLYDLAGSPLVIKPFVDVEGAGEGMTGIVGQVKIGSNSGLRFVSVENFSDGASYGNVEGITVEGDARISNIAVKVGGALGHNLALAVWSGKVDIREARAEVVCNPTIGGQKSWGFYFCGSQAEATLADSEAKVFDCSENHGIGVVSGALAILNGVRVDASHSSGAIGQGIWVAGGQLNMANSTIRGDRFGIVNGGSPSASVIANSSVTGGEWSFYNYGASDLKVSNSLAAGTVFNDATSTIKFFSVADQNLDPVVY